jgi:SAM-dependent methyltransferase
MKAIDHRPHYNLKVPHVSSISGHYRLFIGELNPGDRVLDFGCGHGSLGWLGYKKTFNVTVDGYDMDEGNKEATYHSIADIKTFYDVIIFSHVLEHMDLNEIGDVLSWAKLHGSRIFIALPNTNNIFINFFVDITHVRPYDNADFLYYLELNGFTILKTGYCNISNGVNPLYLFARWVFSLLVGKSVYHESVVICAARR